MTVIQFQQLIADYLTTVPDNTIPAGKALRPNLVGMKIFDAPIVGVASAFDDYLLGLRNTPEARVRLIPPTEWLPSAKSVLSFFLPFTARVKESNREDMAYPSEEWFHARIEGQQLILNLCRYLISALEGEGQEAVAPMLEKRVGNDETNFTSHWSERHVAHACGLGTFSLSKGLITSLGVAGRFGSLVTSLALPVTPRPYTTLYEYCTMCGACAVNCPAGAIDKTQGKQHPPCKDFLEAVRNENAPYYGCGKCQVRVPCESGIPARLSRD